VAIGTTNAIETAPPAAANSYGALKAAVIQYASALGHTLAPAGIRVNTVSPGPVWFAGSVWEHIKTARPELYDNVVAGIPLGSMATDDDIANAVVFLASPAAGHITGANLVVDGGFTKRVNLGSDGGEAGRRSRLRPRVRRQVPRLRLRPPRGARRARRVRPR